MSAAALFSCDVSDGSLKARSNRLLNEMDGNDPSMGLDVIIGGGRSRGRRGNGGLSMVGSVGEFGNGKRKLSHLAETYDIHGKFTVSFANLLG